MTMKMCWRRFSLFLVPRALSRCSVKKCIWNRKECNTFSVFQVENCKRVMSYIDIPSPVNAILHSAPTDANTDFKGIFTLKVKSSCKILHLEYRQHSAGNTVPTSKLKWFERWLQVLSWLRLRALAKNARRPWFDHNQSRNSVLRPMD